MLTLNKDKKQVERQDRVICEEENSTQRAEEMQKSVDRDLSWVFLEQQWN